MSKVSSRNSRGRGRRGGGRGPEISRELRERASRDPSRASPITAPILRQTREYNFLRNSHRRVCLLTLNSPPQPSSNSKRYPSIAGPLCPAQPIIPCPGGGCQATVTLLFSALHSSGISKGAPGAGNSASRRFK